MKGGLAQLADEPFWANAQVFTVLVREEEAQLRRKVEIGLTCLSGVLLFIGWEL
jgi:hypothetical protein